MALRDDAENSLRQRFPFLFGDARPWDLAELKIRRDDLLTNAAARAEPVLRADTLKYQSTLLSFSLLLASISLFKLDKLKIAESTVVVDRHLLIVYTIFTLVIAIAFVIKALADYKRSSLINLKGEYANAEMRRFVETAVKRRKIQLFFWAQVVDGLTQAQLVFTLAFSKLTNAPAPDSVLLMDGLVIIDISATRGVPEFATEVASLDGFLSTLKSELEADKKAFQVEADAILQEYEIESSKLGKPARWAESFERLELARRKSLEPWIAARDNLIGKFATFSFEDQQELPIVQAANDVWTKTSSIRSIYGLTDVLAPLALSGLAAGYVWWHQLRQ
ncbi:MAG TPA: hypothetical protein VK540_32450 [Polyangiaceae bacterium]|nr:hypothetical protein [Polyangiaceae bacterium]